MTALVRRRKATPATRRGPAHRRTHRLVVLLLAALTLPLSLATSSMAATEITVPNPGGLSQAGPVNPAHGFPAWYEDNTGRRLEACVDHLDPLCGIPAGTVPNQSAPMAYPNNFPAEFFYQLAESTVTLRNGGTAKLVLGLEGAFLNQVVNPGDQTVFARVRVDVKGGAAGTTYRFKHPFGELTVDTDGTGRGRFVQDVAPALNNFDTPLAGNFGPFLRWRPGVLPNPPAGQPAGGHHRPVHRVRQDRHQHRPDRRPGQRQRRLPRRLRHQRRHLPGGHRAGRALRHHRDGQGPPQ
jgi:hypothetical protein